MIMVRGLSGILCGFFGLRLFVDNWEVANVILSSVVASLVIVIAPTVVLLGSVL
jgi:hypothetical protein